MITYKILNKDIFDIEVKGHANYSDYGQDIVCSSVSSILIFCANLFEIEELKNELIYLKSDDGYFKMQLKLSNNITKGIVKNLCESLDSLSNDYPKNIKKV